MTREYIITVTAPCECTNAEMDEWVEFCVGYTAQISMDVARFDRLVFRDVEQCENIC